MANINIIDIDGKKTGTMKLPDELFGVEVNTVLLAQAIRVFLNNQRQGTAKTKTRSEVSATTRKWYKQKGTGRARHGAQSAPLFVGGGISHGPSGVQDYSLGMSRVMKQKALASALSQKVLEDKIIVIDGVNKIEGKTNRAAKILANLSLNEDKSSLIIDEPTNNLVRAWRNLDKSKLMRAHMLNTYRILNGGTLVIDKETVGKLVSIYLGNKKKNTISKLETKIGASKATKESVKKETKSVVKAESKKVVKVEKTAKKSIKSKDVTKKNLKATK